MASAASPLVFAAKIHLELTKAPGRDVVLTIGVFDGVHLGYCHLAQKVMRRTQELRCLSGIITLHLPAGRQVLISGESLTAETDHSIIALLTKIASLLITY